jgi:hypothetical protein
MVTGAELIALAHKEVLGLAVSAMKASCNAAWKRVKGSRTPEIPSYRDLQPVSDWLAEHLTAAFVSETGEVDDRVAAFLSSRDYFTYIYHVFVFIFAGRDPLASDVLLAELQAALTRYKYTDEADSLTLHNVLASTATKIAELAKVSEKELPREASVEAHAIIATQYLESIDRQMTTLLAEPHISTEEIESITQDYCSSLQRQFGRLQPQSFEGTDPVPIDGLFVLPQIKTPDGNKPKSNVFEMSKQSYSLNDVANIGRVVILGDPGGGKTTLTRKLARDIALGSIEINGILQSVIPFVVVIRQFGEYLKAEHGSVLDYLVILARSKFQTEISDDVMRYLLASGRVYIIFDGLDELLDTQYRKEIAEIIDAFTWLHPLTNVLVTSRRVGYKHNSLDSDIFTELSLDNFTKTQVESYVRNWFNFVSGLSIDEREIVASRFMSESEHASDIRSNPLMLGLMCTIYKTEAYIPRNRPDVYHKCSKMLFETWDRRRNLFEPLSFEAHLQNVLAHVAYSIYTNPTMQEGVTEAQVVELATDYLSKWAYNESADAISAARDFFEFCKGRGWVLDEFGLNESGAGLFRFAHKTFLEYFAAVHLSRTIPAISELCSNVLPGIIAGDLDIVAELALQMASGHVQGGPDTAIRELIAGAKDCSTYQDHHTLTTFICRSLSYLVPSPKVVTEVCNLAVSGLANPPDRKEALDIYTDSVAELSRAARESRRQICNELGERLITLIQDAGTAHPDSTISLEDVVAAAFNLPSAVTRGPLRDDEAYADLEHVSEAALPLMRENWQTWQWAAVPLIFRGDLSIQAALEFDPDIVFLRSASIPRSNSFYIVPVSLLLRNFLNRCYESPKHYVNKPNDLHECAEYLRNHPEYRSDESTSLSSSLMLMWGDEGDTVPDIEGVYTKQELNDASLVLLFLVLHRDDGRFREVELQTMANEFPSPISDIGVWLASLLDGDAYDIPEFLNDPAISELHSKMVLRHEDTELGAGRRRRRSR